MSKHNFPKYPDDIRDLLDSATVTHRGEAIAARDDVFAAISQDLDGTLPDDGYELDYNRARAKSLWEEHRETLNEIWRGLFG